MSCKDVYTAVLIVAFAAYIVRCFIFNFFKNQALENPQGKESL